MKIGATWLAALALAVFGAGAARAQNTPEALRAEAFEAAQWALASDAAEALAKVAARFAHGDGPLADLAARRERQLAERDGLERRIEALYAQPGKAGDTERAEARRLYGEAVAQLKATDAEIARVFPDYSDLISPKPLSLAQVQSLLKPDEALLLVLVNDEATYVWGVTRETAVWARADGYGAKEVGVAVYRLRAYLAGLPGGGAAYDRATAFELYDRLVRPEDMTHPG